MDETTQNNVVSNEAPQAEATQPTVEQTHDINISDDGTKAEATPKDPTAVPQEETQPQQENQKTQEETTAQVQEEFNKQQQTETDLKQDLSNKGVDFDKLADEYNNTGTLSQQSLDALDKAGYPKSVVDAYLNGLQATTDKFVAEVKGFAGGEEGFANLQSFMRTQPKSVIDAFNSVIEGGNLGQIQLAINGVKAQMVAKYGTANPTVMGQGSVNNNPQGYTTAQQMTKDMSDPRYQTDPAFTREVMRKVKYATFF